MNTTVEKFPECLATLRVEIPAEAVSAEREKIVVAFSRKAKVAGFRPGKVPKGVIEKRYASDITGELLNRLVNSACKEAIKKEELSVLNLEEIKDTSLNEDGTFSFAVDLSLAPEITLPDYKAIPVELPKIEVTEENILNSFEQVREKVADFEPVTHRGASGGDFVVIDYTGNIDGAPIAEAVAKAAGYLAEGNNAWIEVSEGGFLPGFAMQLVDSGLGEQRKVIVRFPKDFKLFELQGVEATYEVTVKEIKTRNLPEVDDAFCEKMFEGRNLEAARQWISENLRYQMERRVDEIKTSQILEFLHNNTQFELPKTAVDRQAQLLVYEMVQHRQMQGIADAEILEHQEEILANASQQARLDVKSRFLLLEVARKEEMTVSQRDMATQVTAMAQRNKVSPKKMVKQLQDANQIDVLRDQILAAKTLDFLKSSASVSYTENDRAPEESSGTESTEPESKDEE
ncbi:MAG: trigger factor [Verrucomicrobia bacterium]|nr:trigger factor [Verrucomicrobiota bacterium]